MTELQTLSAADFTFMRADLSHTMTWNGAAYTVVFGDLADQDELQMAGILENKGVEIWLAVADFSAVTMPGPGDMVTVGSVKYRVVRASDSPDGVCRTLTCEANT